VQAVHSQVHNIFSDDSRFFGGLSYPPFSPPFPSSILSLPSTDITVGPTCANDVREF